MYETIFFMIIYSQRPLTGMAEELTWDIAWGTKNVTEIEVFLQIT